VTPLDDGVNWRLEHDLIYQDSNGTIITVPAGFITDFASIPALNRIGLGVAAAGVLLANFNQHRPFFHWLGHVLTVKGFWIVWISNSLMCDDLLDAPATVHDWGYRVLRGSKLHWDGVLYRAMRATKRPLWKRLIIWFNLVLFGWAAWWSNARKLVGVK